MPNPTEPRGWHSRGYLPHLDAPGVIQAITFRLADSLPRDVQQRFDGSVRPCATAIDTVLDAGHGRCVLRQPAAAKIVVGALGDGDGERSRLHEWVVMPNHVHILIEPLSGQCLSDIMRRLKGITAHRINAVVGRSGRLWQRDYFDRYIRDENHFHRAVAYIRDNPVKAGLSATAEAWPFGSAAHRCR